MEKARLNYIDITKGLGIFSVVLVHLTVSQSLLSQIVLSYCVAMFFIVSGFLFSGKKEPRVFIASIIQKMLIPFIIYQIIDMVYTLVMYLIKNGSGSSIKEVIKIIIKASYVTGSANSNGPLWFLITLIYVEVIFYFLLRLNKKYVLNAVAAVMFILGFFVKEKLLFRFGQIPSSFVLFYMGFCSRGVIRKISESGIKWVYFICSLVMFGLLCRINGFTELAARNFGRIYPVYYVEVFSASIAILSLSMIIGKCRPVEFLGKNSLTIMCCHYEINRLLIPYLFRLAGKETMLENYLVEIILAVAVTAFMVPVCIFVNRYIPVLTGKYNYKFLNKLTERNA